MTMDKNKHELHTVPARKLSAQQAQGDDKIVFFNKLKYMIETAVANYPTAFKYLTSTYGFVFNSTPAAIQNLQKLIQEVYRTDIDHFNRQAKHFGIQIKTRTDQTQQTKIMYKSREPLCQTIEPINSVQDWGLSSESNQSNEEEIDQFPQDQQVNQIMQEKETKLKPNFIKPNIILNKVCSEGNFVDQDHRKYFEDLSIELKLYQQDLFSTPSHNKKHTDLIKEINDKKIDDSAIKQKNQQYKQNYQKCSKLIDCTILELLTAHKNNKIQQMEESLLNNITQIYDILSDNIEHIGSTVKQLVRADLPSESKGRNELQLQLSPGFKPLNQQN